MRQRIPRQPGTKWWILLAAVLAAGLTWLEHRDDRPHPPSHPGEVRSIDAGAHGEAEDDGFVEFEIDD